jgi:hypothetical protein
MKIYAVTKYYNGAAEVTFPGQYADGALAMKVTSLDGEPLFTATVCVVEYGYTPPPGYVVIKNYSENAGVLDTLIINGVVKPSKVDVPGPNEIVFPICELTEAAMAEAVAAGFGGEA